MFRPRDRKKIISKMTMQSWCVAVLLFIFSVAAYGDQSLHTIALPLSLDYALLRTLIVEQAFTQQQESRALVNEGGGCTALVLSRPQVSEHNGAIRLEMQVHTQAGTPIAGQCFTPISWQGYLVVYERPKISDENRRLIFEIIGSELLGADRKPVEIANLLWSLIEHHAYPFIQDISIDLAPPINDLRSFLLPLFPEQVRQQTDRMFASLRPGAISIHPEALRLDILAEVAAVYDPEDDHLLQKLDGAALEQAVALWETWDALLMQMVIAMSRQLLTQDEQQILRNVLLDARYEFINGLSDKSLTRDFVREQFVASWQQMAPIFKRHLLLNKGGSRALGYMAFVSSADALLVFDRLGPTFGLEISRNGLIRLAQMLHAEPDSLNYKPVLNPDLQKLFQIQPRENNQQHPRATKPSDATSTSLPDRLKAVRILADMFSGAADAHAEALVLNDLLRWKVPDSAVDEYVNRVEALLDSSIADVVKTKDILATLQPMFTQLIKAIAWQESCFRQFVVKKGTLTYLLSYNNSSVGLMQVNERVWRGVFSRDRLRWDIRYNTDAGCQIAALYLQKYALAKKNAAARLDQTTLARSVYAMYNGGPSHYRKFQARLKSEKLYQSDTLFWQKYQWVSAKQIAKVRICLIGI